MHPLLRAAADRRLGVFTAADARRAGYDHPEIRWLCSSGRWRRLRRGIYIAAEDLDRLDEGGRRFHAECLAVLLALDRPTAVLSHHSAARLWGLPGGRSRDSRIRLTDPTHGRDGKGFHVVRGPLEPAEIDVRGAFRRTTAARTLADCAREWPLEDAVVAMDAGLLAGRVTLPQLEEAVARTRTWRGGRRAVRAMALADGRAESPLETRGRLRIVGAGLPRPELQVEIRAGGRLVGVVDAWFEDAAIAVEFDGRIKYTQPWRGRSPGQVLWEEKRREDVLRGLDIAVVRIADDDVGVGWPRAEAQVRRLLARPAPGERRFTATPRKRGIERAG